MSSKERGTLARFFEEGAVKAAQHAKARDARGEPVAPRLPASVLDRWF